MLIGHLGYLFDGDLVTLLREAPRVFDFMNGVGVAPAFDPATAAHINRVLNEPEGGILLQVAHSLDVFARFGVIFLLFLVGLESSVEQMRRVGANAARVAVLGVIAPFALGIVYIQWFAPEMPHVSALFVAATLCATSVGITARVLIDLDRQNSPEGNVILGAAVLDDILGLIMLAVVSGIVATGEFRLGSALGQLAVSLLFFGAALLVGPRLLRFTTPYLAGMGIVEAKLFTGLVFLMLLAWIANLAGLAAIVGAFTAGLLLRDAQFDQVFEGNGKVSFRDLFQPLEVAFVPLFFVLLGIQVKLEKLADPQVLLLSCGLIVIAIIGKLIAGIGAGSGQSRLTIGFGMLPRGEVGLIFASIGKALGVISDALFSAVVIMVVVTTLLSPGLLKWSLSRRKTH
jgi:Kef-type K+ transport system membrane component KefB